MGCGEAYTHFRRCLGNKAKKLGEAHLLPGSVRVYILPKECHLLEALVTQVADFFQYTFHVAASFTSTGIRNNTVVAEVVAAAHDADESAYLVSESYALWYYVAVCLGDRQFGIDGLVSQFCLGNQVGKGHVGIGAGNEVNAVFV